ALKDRERHLRALIDNFPFLVWMKDIEGRFLAVNRAFASACDVGDPMHLAGKSDLDVWPSDLAESYRADDRSVMESRERKTVEEEVVDQGSRKWFETFKAPVVDGSGDLLGTVGYSKEISDRKSAEAELERRDALLLGLSRATDHILSGDALTDANIAGALEALGEATDVDRVYIFEHNPGAEGSRGSMSQRYEWSKEGVEPQIDNPELQNASWDELAPRWYDTLITGGFISGNTVDFPDDERSVLEPQGIISLLVLPIESHGSLWGFIGFDVCHGEREWNSSEVALLWSAASSIAVAIDRMRIQAALRDSEMRYRTVADYAYDWESWSAPDGRYLYVSPSCERITGHTAAEFMADPDLTIRIAHPDDCAKVREHFRAGRASAHVDPLEIDFRIVIADGTTRWISHSCVAVHAEDGQWLGRRASNRDVTDRLEAEEAVRHRAWESTHLAEAGMNLIGCHSEDDVFEVIADFFPRVASGAVVLVNQLTLDKKYLVTKSVIGLEGSLFSKAVSLVGFKLIGKRSAVSEVLRGYLFQRSLLRIPGGFSELAVSEIPLAISKAAEKAFGIRDAYTIGIADESVAYGSIHVL
ncbi:MAG: PAS domain S-box protein, partial [bacterium]